MLAGAQMKNNYDRSNNDNKYFIDEATYNCPFCNRRQVKYKIAETGSYDCSNTKTVYFYLVRCEDCEKTSFHLSMYDLKTRKWGNYDESVFVFPLKQVITRKSASHSRFEDIEKDILNEKGSPKELDEVIFYSQPTSFFTIDERIPKSIREPLSESDNCLKSNFITGASGALRKAVYKLLKHEKIPEKNDNSTIKHAERIEYLKKKYPTLEPDLLNELKTIHALTSQELHENDWEDFNAHQLRFLITVTKEILLEMYVTPDAKEKRRKELADLKEKAKKTTLV